MKYKMELYRIWEFELKCHNVDLLHDDEWTKSLVIQFLWRLCCLNILLLKPNLVSNIENCLFLMMFVNIFVVHCLCAFSRLNTSCAQNVHQPQGLIFGYKIHNLVHALVSNLRCKPWFAKNGIQWFVNEYTMLLNVYLIILMIISCLSWILFQNLIDLFCFSICLEVEN
jgi:hypothetical protein